MKSVHRLTSKDIEAMTGVCQVCGPVELRWRNSPNKAGTAKIVQCATARYLDRVNSRRLTKQSHGLNAYQAKEFLKGKACAICGSEENLAVDHCHVQGKIRDALCRACNTTLGLFGEDPERFLAAAEYLKRHRVPD